jgi:hypothetical protein
MSSMKSLKKALCNLINSGKEEGKMSPITKDPSGQNLSSEEMEKMIRQFQKSSNGRSSSPIGGSGRSLSSFDLGRSSYGIGGSLGSSYRAGVPSYSRSNPWVRWVIWILVVAALVAGIWVLIL